MRKSVSAGTRVTTIGKNKEPILVDAPAQGTASPSLHPAGLIFAILRFGPVAALICGLVLTWLMGWQHYFSLEFLESSRLGLKAAIDARPITCALLCMLFCVLAVVLMIPGASLLTLFAGAFFGWMAGGALVTFAVTLGGTIVFLSVRGAFRNVLRLHGGPRILGVASAIEDNAFYTILVLRLAPICPFFITNIAAPLLDIPLRTFVVATFLGVIPVTFTYAWLGRGLDSIIAAAHDSGRAIEPADLLSPEIVTGMILLTAIAALPLMARAVRKKVRNRG